MFPNENSEIYRDQSYAFEKARGKNASWVVQPKESNCIWTALKAEKHREHMWDGVHLCICMMNTVEKTMLSIVSHFFST